MAEFQNIDLYAKKRGDGWLGKLLTISIIIFVIAVGLYVAAIFYQNFLNKSIDEINSKTKALSKEISETDRAEVLSFYSQLINLKTLLAQHLYSSNILEKLELITHPKVAYSSFNYDNKNNTLKLDGYTDNLEFLAQQVLAFQRISEFTKVTLSNIKFAGNKIIFSVEINFKPGFILK